MARDSTSPTRKKRDGPVNTTRAAAARGRRPKKAKRLHGGRDSRSRAAGRRGGRGQERVEQMRLSKLRANRWGDAVNPEIYPAERETLKRSIEKHGIQTALVGRRKSGRKLVTIVTGCTRLAIARELGLKAVPVILKEFAGETEAKIFALQDNLARRHLTVPQKAQLALEYQKLLRVGQGHRTDLKPEPSSRMTKVDARKEAAKLVGVSEGSISNMKKVVESGDEKLVQEVHSGETSVAAAARVVDAKAERPEPIKRETVGANNRVYAAIVGGNAELMANAASLYIEPGSVVADVTYGNGAFWTDVDLSKLTMLASDIDPIDKDVKRADLRDLSYSDRTVDVVVIDPQYDQDSATALTKLGRRAINGGKKHGDTVNLHRDALAEAIRVTKVGGLIMVKIGDGTESGKYYHIDVKAIAEEFGLITEDMFVLVRNTPPPVRRRNQKRAKRNYSFLWVLRRPG